MPDTPQHRRFLQVEPPRTIVVLRALQLGDLLCAVPALRSLRTGFPDAHISLVGLPWAREFVQRLGAYVDELIEFPGYPGLPERGWEPKAVARFLDEMQGRRPDLAIQMHGDGSLTNPLVALFGARYLAGFVGGAAWAPESGSFMPYPEDLSEVRRHIALMRFLGLPDTGEGLEFPVTDADRREARSLLAEAGVTGDYALVHPGARAAERRWPLDDFSALTEALEADGIRVILTGSSAERSLTAGVAERSRSAVDTAGRTSLGGLAALVESARVVVCNDTGVSHVAAALRVPSVVLFSTSDPARWAPLDRVRHRVVRAGARDAVASALDQARELVRLSSGSARTLRPVA
jgi:ADP-heptose:LPS heptosyltransferase